MTFSFILYFTNSQAAEARIFHFLPPGKVYLVTIAHCKGKYIYFKMGPGVLCKSGAFTDFWEHMLIQWQITLTAFRI